MKDPAVDRSDGFFGEGEFERVAALLKSMTGIHLTDNKRTMAAGRLSKRLKALGLSSVASYCDVLQAPGSGGEQDAFISALTTNMTRFFREPHHFRHLGDHVLPDLVARARRGGRVRIWSAGCSMGEEAYDLACHLLDVCPEAERLDIKILASDIDKQALDIARAGTYATPSLENLPNDFAARFFEPDPKDPGVSRIRKGPRDLICFRWLNLNAQWPFAGKFDAIMCRNVAIYFDAPTQADLWRRMVTAIQTPGTLYIGHSEMLPRDILDNVSQVAVGAFRVGAPLEKALSASPPIPSRTEMTR